MKELAPGIVLFEDVFPNAMEYIKRIQDENISWRAAEVLVNEEQHESGTNTKARDTDLIMLPHHESTEDGVLAEFTREFHKHMKPCLDQYMAHYYAKIEKFEGPQLLRYGKEQKFHDHIDDHPFFTRRISLTFYLNDDYKGGELHFPKQNIAFKPKARAAYFFPGDRNFIHGVTEIKSGMRYTCPFFWTILEHTGERQP